MRLLVLAPDWMVQHNCASPRNLKLTIRDEDVVHHVPDAVYINDQHRHYQISFLIRTPHAREWDDSHVPCSCHRGSFAVGSHCLSVCEAVPEGLTNQTTLSRKLSAGTYRSSY